MISQDFALLIAEMTQITEVSSHLLKGGRDLCERLGFASR